MDCNRYTVLSRHNIFAPGIKLEPIPSVLFNEEYDEE